MEREVRYCTTEDGVRIAYCVQGEGPPLLVCPIFVESFSLEHLIPEYGEFLTRLSIGRSLIRYDIRGTGLSERRVAGMSVKALVADLAAVVEAVGFTALSIWAPTASGPVAITYAAEWPDKVRALILYGTFPRIADLWPADVLGNLAALSRTHWELAAHTFAGPTRVLGPLFMRSMLGEVAASLLEGAQGLDVSAAVSNIRARTLVIHRIDDTLVPLASGQNLAAHIPNSRFITPPGSRNAFFQEGIDIADTVNAFLNEDPETRALRTLADQTLPTSGLRMILFTDLVGHTEMMSRLGDERGRDVLREHERITRDVLKSHAGTEVKTMGDGFLASFGSVTKAVECAIALQRAFAEREGEPLSVRVGLNAGEPIEEDGDLFGATVILASRIAAKADGGEILVADTVRGLCSGKGFLFADRGEFVAKGFEEPVRVYEVSWRE